MSFLDDITDDELVSDIEFALSIMATDSKIDDVVIEYLDNVKVTYRELLEEAARRAEK